MSLASVMSVLASVAVIALSVVAILGIREVVTAAKTLTSVAEDLRATALPLAQKVEVTVDAINVEILRVDEIIARFEDAGERVSSASGAIKDIVSSPAGVVTNVADRLRRAWKDRSRT